MTLPQLAGPGTSNWTFEAGPNAVQFSDSAGLVKGDQIGVTYPIGCK